MLGAGPAQRLLARGVIASTLQLVRCLAEDRPADTVHGLMAERRRLLDQLARELNAGQAVGSLAALHAAVAESDRTLEALLG